jgi:hypothetical protein
VSEDLKMIQEYREYIPRSLMFRTPGYDVEPVLRWPFSLGGDDDRPWTAESTFVNGSMVGDWMAVVVLESWEKRIESSV